MTSHQQRKLNEAKSIVVDLINELCDKVDSMSEDEVESEEGERLKENIDALTYASDALDEVAP